MNKKKLKLAVRFNWPGTCWRWRWYCGGDPQKGEAIVRVLGITFTLSLVDK